MKDTRFSKSITDYYDKNAGSFFESTVNVNMEHLYKPFLELIPQGAKILDAGCGSGRDSFYFLNKGYHVIAFDSSIELVKLSSQLIKKEVLHLSFYDLDFSNDFDAIWACASLLHIPKNDIFEVLIKLFTALKQDAILYASFKYGNKEEIKQDRYFNYYDEVSFKELIHPFKEIELINIWKSTDAREDRKDEYWLNILLKKGI